VGVLTLSESSLISIIIPVYNRSQFLREALQSCVQQIYSPIEVIVVDDGSEEDIQSVVKESSSIRGGAYFHYMRQVQSGASAARNRGLRESSGQFIQFLDSDDILHPQKLSQQLSALVAGPHLDMVFSLSEFFHLEPGDSGVFWNGLFPKPTVEDFLWDNAPWDTNAPLWRRSTIERIGPWNEELRYGQDWEFHVRSLLTGIYCLQLPQVLSYVREHQGNRISAGQISEQREAAKLMCRQTVAELLQRMGQWEPATREPLAVGYWQAAISWAWAGLRGLALQAYSCTEVVTTNRRLRLLARGAQVAIRTWPEDRAEPPRWLRLLHRIARVARVGQPRPTTWRRLRWTDLALS